ncbi:transcriptional activator HAP5 [Kwoniella heveanensis BCC8398]|uniref:Transcriptional activator HAP5 n=1 Tax=Kwoniella heveanensis BCC8398 TaxID=1296120 RepID=A0A1B9GXG3_9TREE|nr:transcriptional activator HAP5 [Kwoniella heveanensis BCC8398]
MNPSYFLPNGQFASASGSSSSSGQGHGQGSHPPGMAGSMISGLGGASAGAGPSSYSFSSPSVGGSGSVSASSSTSPDAGAGTGAGTQQHQQYHQIYASQAPSGPSTSTAEQHRHQQQTASTSVSTTGTPATTSAAAVHTGPMILPHQDLNSFLESFWTRQMDNVEGENPDWKSYNLPLARIKKVMKSDEEVRMISAEAPIMFSKACEIFISELTCRAWLVAESHKRRTLQKSDVAAAIAFSDMFDFLIDIVPRDDGSSADAGNGNGANDTPAAGGGNGSGNGTNVDPDEDGGEHHPDVVEGELEDGLGGVGVDGMGISEGRYQTDQQAQDGLLQSQQEPADLYSEYVQED